MPLRIIPHLHHATHAVAVLLDRTKQSLPVTQAEAHVLAFLHESRGSCSIADLHGSFGHKRSTLTGIVDRLEQRGLIERAIHPEDRRSFLLTLTHEGVQIARGVYADLRKLEARIARALGPADTERLVAAFAALTLALDPTNAD